MKKTSLSLFVLAFAGTAGATEFLPLHEGDWSLYAGANGATREARVDDGAGYWSHVTDFLGAGARWLASDGTDPQLWAYDETAQRSVMLADYSRPVGTRFAARIGACTNGVVLAAKGQTVTVPAGTYAGVVRLDFGTQCADAGIASAWFAPQVGVVKWTERSIAGPRDYALRQANIGGVSHGAVASSPSLRITADLPGPKVLINVTPIARATLRIENTGNADQEFRCASAQEFDIRVQDAAGAYVTSWAATHNFAQQPHTFRVPAGATREIGGEIDLRRLDDGQPLEIGSYTIAIELRCDARPEATAFAPVPSYSAQGPLFIDRRVTIGF